MRSSDAWDIVLDNAHEVERVIQRNSTRLNIEYAELHADAYAGAHRAALTWVEEKAPVGYWVMLGAQSGVKDALRRVWGRKGSERKPPTVPWPVIGEDGEMIDFPDLPDYTGSLLEIADIAKHCRLNPREETIVQMLAWGFRPYEIAKMFEVSPSAISLNIKRIRSRFDKEALK